MPDLALINGKIATVDKQDRFVTAVAIRNGRFVAAGSDMQVLSHTDRGTQVIDLGGRTAIPGIVDSHNHIIHAGVLLEGVMLFDARTIDDVKAAVARRVAKARPGEWIEGGGWIESQFAEFRAPNRWDLDEVSPENPVILDRLFGASAVNSKALESAGIDRNTPDPRRGQIERDPKTGEPTGVLRNGAQSLVDSVIAARPAGDLLERTKHLIDITCREYIRWGITSIVEPGVPPLAMQAYQQMRDAGRLPIRLNMMPAWWGLFATAGQANLDKVATALGARTGLGDEWLRVGALKMAIDGGLASKTAMLNAPFIDGTWSTIPLRLDIDRLEEYFTTGIERDWSIGIHCCGDRAQDLACEAFARVLDRTGRKPARHHIIHGYLPTPRALEIMAEYGIGVSVQPGFMWVEGDMYYHAVDVETVNYFKPLQTYAKHGIVAAANSDMTSAHYNPFFGMHSAVTRRTSQGRVMGEAERVADRNQMLRLFTVNGAWLTGEEDLKGSIEPGKLGDVAVLSGDLFTVPEDEIRELKVVLTVVGGTVVHREM